MATEQHGLESDVVQEAGAGPAPVEVPRAKDRQIKSILVLIAMEAEAAPLLAHLGLQQDSPPAIARPAPCTSYSGTRGEVTIHVVVNGKCLVHGVDNVGTVPAALTAYLAVQAFDPDLVISTGTAGGFRAQGAAIGDVFLSTAMLNHDRRIPIGPFVEYGIGRYAAVPTPALQAALGLKAGIVTSGNSLDYTDRDMEIMREHGAAVKEMEAAAIAWSCSLFSVPCFCVKAITDIVDGDRPAQEEFLQNLATAAAALQETLPNVIDFVSGKWYHEL